MKFGFSSNAVRAPLAATAIRAAMSSCLQHLQITISETMRPISLKQMFTALKQLHTCCTTQPKTHGLGDSLMANSAVWVARKHQSQMDLYTVNCAVPLIQIINCVLFASSTVCPSTIYRSKKQAENHIQTGAHIKNSRMNKNLAP